MLKLKKYYLIHWVWKKLTKDENKTIHELSIQHQNYLSITCKQAYNKNNGAQIPAPLTLQINYNYKRLKENIPFNMENECT